MRRLLRTLTLAGLAYAGWELYKRATAEEPSPAAAPTPQSSQSSAPKRAPKAKAAKPSPKPAAKRAASNGGSASTSKAELYERATELGIKGRSKMSKAELERAIRDAG